MSVLLEPQRRKLVMSSVERIANKGKNNVLRNELDSAKNEVMSIRIRNPKSKNQKRMNNVINMENKIKEMVIKKLKDKNNNDY